MDSRKKRIRKAVKPVRQGFEVSYRGRAYCFDSSATEQFNVILRITKMGGNGCGKVSIYPVDSRVVDCIPFWELAEAVLKAQKKAKR